MAQSLQYKFIESKGLSVQIGKWKVIQCDRIPIHKGFVTLRFLSMPTGMQGIALKTKKGGIKMSDGRKVKLLHVWHMKNLPSKIKHEVDCPTGELLLWNIYRIKHPDSSVTEDEWTGNAGMVLLCEDSYKRRYGCSDSLGSFSPHDLEFELEWCEL